MIDTTDVLKGVNVDMRKHWEDDLWHIETHDRKVLLIGTKDKILAEYDRLNSTVNNKN